MCLSQGLVLVRNGMCGRKKKNFGQEKERERKKERKKKSNGMKKKYAHLILEVDCLSFSFFFLGLLSIKHNSNVTLFD